jgi:phosphoglycerate dehydrogenase-like enzyme
MTAIFPLMSGMVASPFHEVHHRCEMAATLPKPARNGRLPAGGTDMRIAILDDWQNAAETLTDWRAVSGQADLMFFYEAFADLDAAAHALEGFDAVVAMRERTPFPAELLERLPRLKLLSYTGARNAAVDAQACARLGIVVCNTTGLPPTHGTAELALGLMLAAARQLPLGDAEIRAGRFQQNLSPGIELAGLTLGLVGLGRIGGRMARYGLALGMEIIAWSTNLTEAAAASAGATRVAKDELLARADVVSLHLVLSPRSRGIIAASDIGLLKPGAILVNTSRSGLVDQAALLDAVRDRRIVAAIDVFDREPLAPDDPWRMAPNTVLSPHLGYVTRGNMAALYRESAENLAAWLDGAPIRVVT